MSITVKQKIPLIFLIVISAWWAFYYRSNSPLNEFGEANFEWLYLLDGLIVLPVLCFLCLDDKKQAALKALALSCLVVLIGSFIIHEEDKTIWHALESGRYLIIGLFFLFECAAILSVCLAIKTALRCKNDPDLTIANAIKKITGESLIANILILETRVWTFALLAKLIDPQQFNGQKHFSYHSKDGAQSNSLGFIILLCFELPLLHLALHFIWSPLAANITTALTLMSLVFFIAEYRAMSRRPISIDNQRLYIRFGLYNTWTVHLSNIKEIRANRDTVFRHKTRKRYNFSGKPNIAILLKQADDECEEVYLGIDDPQVFIQEIAHRIEPQNLEANIASKI